MERVSDKMKVFLHQVYECKKGVRSMAMCTVAMEDLPLVRRKLEVNGMAFQVCPIRNGRANVFFGEKECIEVLRCFSHKPLNYLTPEEDFILGTMLGYGVREQCRRYRRKKPSA